MSVILELKDEEGLRLHLVTLIIGSSPQKKTSDIVADATQLEEFVLASGRSQPCSTSGTE